MPSAIRDILNKQGQRPQWDPKFDFARDDGQRLRPIDEEDASPNWEPAPADSHLLAFKFVDGRKKSKLARSATGGETVIMIRFKPSGRRGVSEYHYFSDDHAYMDTVWDLLIDAESPGEVVLHILIPDGVSYRRVS